jgi:hypothetical protein
VRRAAGLVPIATGPLLDAVVHALEFVEQILAVWEFGLNLEAVSVDRQAGAGDQIPLR